MNKIFNVDFRKLGLLLLPTFLRQPVLSAIVNAMVSPIGYLHTSFIAFRNDSNYRLSHNGQVCYLRAVLNDLFDPQTRRITIGDIPGDVDGFTLYQRSVGRAKSIPRRDPERLTVINRRGFGGANRCDFEIMVPAVLQASITQARINAVVNMYKLATKRFMITYISNA